MPVVVQRIDTNLYWAENGGWVQAVSEAKDFGRSGVAIVHCVKERLRNVRVGMLFGDPEMDVYYYPFSQETREQTQELRKEAETLKAKKKALVDELKAAIAELAQQAASLPMPRKSKRETPPQD